MSHYRLITFDAYSALADQPSSLVPVISGILGLSSSDAAQVLQVWRAKQLERAALSNHLGKGRTSFRDCTRQALDYAAQRFKLTIDRERHAALVSAWDQLEPWPEAARAIAAVKAKGYRVAILSNGDEDMLRALADSFGIAFDHILSSQDCGYYKPHPSVYALPSSMLGIAAKDYLHVAGGANDALGAAAAGVDCYWSNRHGDFVLDLAYAPVFERTSLDDLPNVL
jgi:2-haloacid dehalogenase